MIDDKMLFCRSAIDNLSQVMFSERFAQPQYTSIFRALQESSYTRAGQNEFVRIPIEGNGEKMGFMRLCVTVCGEYP